MTQISLDVNTANLHTVHVEQQTQQQQVAQQQDEKQPAQAARLAADMDMELFRRMKIRVAAMGLKGYGELITIAVTEYLDREETKIA